MSSSATAACTVKAHRSRWYVPHGRRNVQVSAFNGYRPEYSDYSDVACPLDHDGRGIRLWRTKASYVDELPSGDYSPDPEGDPS